MSVRRSHNILWVLCALVCGAQASGQATVGTLNLSSNANQDYVLFSPNGAETTHIIDKCGRQIHQWETDGRPGLMAYFTDNGDLVRTRRHQTGEFLGGGIGGIIERFDWEGNMLWTDTLASPSHHQHHDIAVMPNGNILAILWEKWFAEDAIARGQLPELASEEVWVTRVFELAPLPGTGSEVVWSWSPWEHLIQNTDPALPNYGEPSEHPERFDINFEAIAESWGGGFGQEGAYDWMHVNSIHYHPERDEIVLSSRHWNEIWVIDHSTTPRRRPEAAEASTGRAEIYFGGGAIQQLIAKEMRMIKRSSASTTRNSSTTMKGSTSAFTTTASVDQMAATALCTTSLSPWMQTADTPGPVNRPSGPMRSVDLSYEPGLIILLSQYLRL